MNTFKCGVLSAFLLGVIVGVAVMAYPYYRANQSAAELGQMVDERDDAFQKLGDRNRQHWREHAEALNRIKKLQLSGASGDVIAAEAIKSLSK